MQHSPLSWNALSLTCRPKSSRGGISGSWNHGAGQAQPAGPTRSALSRGGLDKQARTIPVSAGAASSGVELRLIAAAGGAGVANAAGVQNKK